MLSIPTQALLHIHLIHRIMPVSLCAWKENLNLVPKATDGLTLTDGEYTVTELTRALTYEKDNAMGQ